MPEGGSLLNRSHRLARTGGPRQQCWRALRPEACQTFSGLLATLMTANAEVILIMHMNYTFSLLCGSHCDHYVPPRHSQARLKTRRSRSQRATPTLAR